MELTDKEIQLLARLSRDRGLYAECKGADLDALQELGLLQWFDTRSSTTPFKQDPRPLLKLHGTSGRIDYAWIAAVENWRERVGPEVSAKVDAIDEIEWAVNSGPFTAAGLVEQTASGPRSLDASAALRSHETRDYSERRLPQPIRDLLWFVLIGAVVGAVYGHMIAVSDGAPLLGFRGLLRGVLTGVVITGALFFFEQVWARPAMAQLRGLPFLPHLAIKTVIYLVIVLVGLAIGARLFPAPAEVGAELPIRHQDVLFSFAVVLAIRFIDDINHLLGQNVLRNFITGYYHRPRLEERVFLFIDIEGSTALAERLGEFAFHRLINRFVGDITEPIVAAYGEIHRYVGDELIASWKLADGIANAHCVRACFDAFDRLAALSPVYVRDFGTPLHCRAGLHCGPVVTGEMGSVKKEIVFLGDTVNTTARIQEFCRQTDDRVLASAGLVNRLELPIGIVKRPLGDLHLRGKANDVVLYALEKERADSTAAAASLSPQCDFRPIAARCADLDSVHRTFHPDMDSRDPGEE